LGRDAPSRDVDARRDLGIGHPRVVDVLELAGAQPVLAAILVECIPKPLRRALSNILCDKRRVL
jgi:hypothetical protein